MKRANIRKQIPILSILMVAVVFSSCTKVDTSDEYDHREDIKVTNVTFDAPEGMDYDEETGNASIEKEDMAVYFNYWKSDSKEEIRTFDDFDEEICRGIENEVLKSMYGKEIDFEITRFEKYKIDGIPAYRFDEEYTVDGQNVLYTAIMVGADEIHTFNYEQDGTLDYTEAIEESIKSIHFEYEEK